MVTSGTNEKRMLNVPNSMNDTAGPGQHATLDTAADKTAYASSI